MRALRTVQGAAIGQGVLPNAVQRSVKPLAVSWGPVQGGYQQKTVNLIPRSAVIEFDKPAITTVTKKDSE